MTFTVTYRGADGALCAKPLKASRSAERFALAVFPSLRKLTLHFVN